MKSNKMHLVPQIVIDCAEGLTKAKQDNVRSAYEMRLEAIRDYCDDVLKSSKTFNPNDFNFVKRNRK